MTSNVAQISPFGSAPWEADAATQVVEARADPRVAVDLAVQLDGADFAGPLAAQARDISVGGMCVATRSILSLASLRHVTLPLPRGKLRLAVAGRWQVDSPSEDSVLTGVAFVEPDPPAVSALWSLVQRAGNELVEFLHQHSDLRALGADDAMGIAQVSRFRNVPSGRAIYAQDATAPGDDSIFILRAGSVTLHHRFAPADEVTVARLAPGSVFGGLPIVAEVPNLESATAEGSTTLIEVSRGAYTRLRLARPILAQRITQIAARHHAERVRRLLELASRHR